MTSPLNRLLGEYAVPLQVWLGPAARRIAADVLIDTMGTLAEVHPDPIPSSARLKGPAVLVVAAEDLDCPQRGALSQLAQQALPGRVVLIGGTSDRDVLLDAINTWRAIRVVPSTAPGAEIVDAVRAAGEALRKAVALETAIDDLDIENTMLDSAIGQMEASSDYTVSAAHSAAISTMSQGLAQAVSRDQQTLEGLAGKDESLAQAMRGVQTVTDLLGQVHTRASEQASGLPATPESVDAMVAAAVELASGGPGGTVQLSTDTQALSTINPYALIHLLAHLIRSTRATSDVMVRCTTESDYVEIQLDGPAPTVDTAHGPVARSVEVLREEGATITDRQEGVCLRLPRVEED